MNLDSNVENMDLHTSDLETGKQSADELLFKFRQTRSNQLTL